MTLFAKQNISILGCGWLGTPLSIYLLQNNFDIKVSVTSNDKLENLKSKNLNPFLIKLDSFDANIKEFLNSEILIISIPPQNINEFKSLISHIESSRVKKIIFISSISVYDNSNQKVTEKSPTNNSLLRNIELLFINNNKFVTTIIRFGGLFGYNRIPGNFIPQNKKMENPEGYVNLIHRDDCIRIIEQIIEKGVWNEIFNACTDTHPNRRDFYSKEALKLGKNAPVFNENSLNEYKIIDSSKLKSMLDFSFKYADLMKL